MNLTPRLCLTCFERETYMDECWFCRTEALAAQRRRPNRKIGVFAHPVNQSVYLPPAGSIARQFLGRVISSSGY